MEETPTFVKKLTTTFIKYIGPPAAIAALLFGAIAIHKTKWFWMIIGIIFLIAFFTTILPTVKLWKMYITNYRTVKSKLDQLENENEKFKENENLQELLPSFEESVLNARSSGILEGRAQIEGAIYAIRSPIPIIASAELQDGEIIILATAHSPIPTIGARYDLISTPGRVRRGIVQLVDIDEKMHLVYLKPIDKTSRRFWESLSEQVEGDTTGILSQVTLVANDAKTPLVTQDESQTSDAEDGSTPEVAYGH